MCQTQLGHVQGRCWQAQHEAALQVAWEWSHLVYALNQVMREARKAHMVLSSDSDWMQTGLFGHQFLTKPSHNLHFLLSLLGYPFISCLLLFLSFPTLFYSQSEFLLDLGHRSHSTSAFCLTTRLSQLFHLPFTFPREG